MLMCRWFCLKGHRIRRDRATPKLDVMLLWCALLWMTLKESITLSWDGMLARWRMDPLMNIRYSKDGK